MINSFIKKYTIIFFISFFAFSYSNSTNIVKVGKEKLEKIGEIPVIIGNDIIFSKEIIKNCKLNILNEIFIKRLMLYYARKDPYLKIDDKELKLQYQTLFSEFIKKNRNINLSQEDEDLVDMIKNDQYIRSFYKKKTDDIEVSPKEVRDFFNKNKKGKFFIPKKLCISCIIFSPRFSNIKKRKIINFLHNIKNNYNKYNKINYFNIGNLPLNEIFIKKLKISFLPEEFKNVINNLKKGEISDPFETELGFHLIKLENKIGDEIDIKHILVRYKYDKNMLYNTKLFANLIRKRLLNGKISKNKIQNTSILENICVYENDLSKNMKKACRFLKKGKISYPYEDTIDGKKIFFIIKLLDEIPSRPISIDKDYIILENLVKEIKKKEKIKNWLKGVLDKTYIRMNCSS
ncbi:peptidylprolyl isomerase [Blattabacterium cuenoti]|uniref:peptidylprolyl isomerase n=1 Tax=Blattabacterium cuenoti TaxID=1653831 RepID=UPI001EEC0BDB|nr:peptidylprolyl isomerase [Blattabacterium cuenoti]